MASPAPNFSDTQKSALVQQIITGGLSPEQACARYGLSTEQLKDWVRHFCRTVRHALDQQLRRRLSVQGLDLDELTEFSGNLADIGVADLLQTIQGGRKDVHITVTHDGEVSEIWCRRGEVIDAHSASLEGEAAFYRILAVEDGRLVADFAPSQRARRITLSTPRLLLKAASSNGLRARLMHRIGDPRQVFSVAPGLAKRRTPSLRADERAVLELFDGVRSVEEVIIASGLSDARALEIIAHFRERHILGPSPERDASLVSLRTELVARDGRDAPESLPPSANVTMSCRPIVEPPPLPVRPATWVLAVGAMVCSSLGAVAAVALADALAPVPPQLSPVTTVERDPPAPRASVPPAALPSTQPGPSAPAAQPFLPVLPTSVPEPIAVAAACPGGMVRISAGSFTMGSDLDRPALGLAHPTHAVTVTAFCLGAHEVTVAEYAACSDGGACTPAHRDAHFADESEQSGDSNDVALHGTLCNVGRPGRDRHPINCVSHAQASAYCEAQGGRLPSEAEWEFAARGPESRAYPWGSARPTRAHANACGKECARWHAAMGLETEMHGLMFNADDGFAGTAPVGSFPLGASPDGVDDMIGNVFEWTSGGLYDYSSEAAVDPQGPADTDSFVIRGGNFNSGVREFADPALRFAMHRDSYSHGVGFRCAAGLSENVSPTSGPSSVSSGQLPIR